MSYAMMAAAQVQASIRDESARNANSRIDRILADLQSGTMASHEIAERDITHISDIGTALGDEALRARVKNLRRLQTDGKVDSNGESSSGAAATDAGARSAVEDRQKVLSDKSTIESVANFLRKSEDEVRLQAARQDLVFELSHAPTFTASSSGSSSAFAVRTAPMMRSLSNREQAQVGDDTDSFRTWEAEDDVADVRLLELRDGVAKLIPLVQDVDRLTQEQGQVLDEVAEETAKTRDNVEEGVAHLADAEQNKRAMQRLVGVPIGVFAVVGVVVPGPMQCIAGLLAVKLSVGALAGGATAAVAYASESGRRSALEDTAGRLELTKAHLLKAFEPFDTLVTDKLCNFGDTSARALVETLQANNWTDMYFCPRASWVSLKRGKHFQLRYRPSDCRAVSSISTSSLVSFAAGPRISGYAYKTEFEVAGLPAADGFRVIERLHVCGSLDPGCEMSWNFPIRGCVGSRCLSTGEVRSATAVRLAAFSNFFYNRNFFVVCRTGVAGEYTDSAPPTFSKADEMETDTFPESSSDEIYIVVMASMPDSNAPDLPLPVDSGTTGIMQLCGVAVQSSKTGCRVSVMADVDPQGPAYTPLASDFAVDVDVRARVLETASRLYQELTNHQTVREAVAREAIAAKTM